MIDDICDLISTLSPCGTVRLLQKDQIVTNEDLNVVKNWWRTDVPCYKVAVYLDAAEFINVKEELIKLSSQRNKVINDFEILKSKHEKHNCMPSDVEIDSFNSEICRLNDREKFLIQLQHT